jgi:hypothetical protein
VREADDGSRQVGGVARLYTVGGGERKDVACRIRNILHGSVMLLREDGRVIVDI